MFAFETLTAVPTGRNLSDSFVMDRHLIAVRMVHYLLDEI